MQVKVLSDRTKLANGEVSIGTISGVIESFRNPLQSLEAATKQYVDIRKTSINANNISGGILSINRLPSFGGDFTNAEGSNSLTLNNTTVIPGTYVKVHVDSKGRITAGYDPLLVSDLPGISWNKITDKPTTLAGYGITDALLKTGGSLTGYLTLASDPLTDNDFSTKGYVDSKATPGSFVYKVGDVIESCLSTTPTGFLRCNGALVSKTTYANLYAVIGDTYNKRIPIGNGRPWEQQYEFNNDTNTLSNSTTLNTVNLGNRLGSFNSLVVTKNKVYILGGYYYDNLSDSNKIYKADIDSNGTIGTFTDANNNLPFHIHNYPVIFIYKDKLYFMFGMLEVTYENNNVIYRCNIDSNGNLSSWVAAGTTPISGSMMRHIIVGNYIYFIGGLNYIPASIPSYDTIYRGTIDSNGDIVNILLYSKLPYMFYGMSIFVVGNRIYLSSAVEGFYTFSYNNFIYYFEVLENGDLSELKILYNVFDTCGFFMFTAGSTPIVTKNKIYLFNCDLLLNPYTSTWTDYPRTLVADIYPDNSIGAFSAIDFTSAYSYVYFENIICTSSKIYFVSPFITDGYVSYSFYIDFNGGLNDYSQYNATVYTTDTTKFHLPDSGAILDNSIYSYIKY